MALQGECPLAVDDGNALLAAGLGVVWLPEYMAKPHLPRARLVRLFEDWHFDPMPLYMAWPSPFRTHSQ